MTPLSFTHSQTLDPEGWTESMFWLQYNKAFRLKSAKVSIVCVWVDLKEKNSFCM